MTITDEPVTTRRGAHLVPFDSERASLAGKKSAEARRAKRDVQRRENQALAHHLRSVRDAFERNDLGPTAAAFAQHLMSQVITGLIPVRNGSEAAELIKCAVDIARLESGEATSLTVQASMTTDQVRARLEQIQGQLATPKGAGQSPIEAGQA